MFDQFSPFSTDLHHIPFCELFVGDYSMLYVYTSERTFMIFHSLVHIVILNTDSSRLPHSSFTSGFSPSP